MVNIAQSPDGVPRRLHQPNVQRMRGMVRQDNPAPHRIRTASPQPVVRKNIARTHQTNTTPPRSKKHSKKRRTVQISGWGRPQLKTELQRIADQEGLSLSQTVIAGLEEWVRQQLHVQHTVLIQPIIETTLRRYFSRMTFYLARIAFDIGVIKGLMIWLCRREAGASKEQVDSIIHQSRERARKSMTRVTPELKSLLEELKTILQEEEGN